MFCQVQRFHGRQISPSSVNLLQALTALCQRTVHCCSSCQGCMCSFWLPLTVHRQMAKHTHSRRLLPPVWGASCLMSYLVNRQSNCQCSLTKVMMMACLLGACLAVAAAGAALVTARAATLPSCGESWYRIGSACWFAIHHLWKVRAFNGFEG